MNSTSLKLSRQPVYSDQLGPLIRSPALFSDIECRYHLRCISDGTNSRDCRLDTLATFRGGPTLSASSHSPGCLRFVGRFLTSPVTLWHRRFDANCVSCLMLMNGKSGCEGASPTPDGLSLAGVLGRSWDSRAWSLVGHLNASLSATSTGPTYIKSGEMVSPPGCS